MKDVFEQAKSIKLNLWDKLFLFCFTILVLYLFSAGMTILTFGGIVLIYGAFLTYKGQIYLSVVTYITADFCWIFNAWNQSDKMGVLFIGTGIIFGILATAKMKMGHMEKDLLKQN